MGASDPLAGHAFISYGREDHHEVDALQQALEAAGVHVWRDTSDLWPGEDWRMGIRYAITRNALVFIACFSSRSVARQRIYQNEELTLAIEQLHTRQPDVPWLIPVRFDDCRIPDRDIGGGRTMMSLHCCDVFGDNREASLTRLVATVLRILGQDTASAAGVLPEGTTMPADAGRLPPQIATAYLPPVRRSPPRKPPSFNPGNAAELGVPAVMRIGAARMTAGLDCMGRLDLAAHREIFGPLPRISAQQLIEAASHVDLRGQGGAAFPVASKLKAVIDAAEKTDKPALMVVNCAETDPGSFKDKMLMIRSPYLILSGAALVAEAIAAEEIIIAVTGSEFASQSMKAAIAAEPGLHSLTRVIQQPQRFISGESAVVLRSIKGKKPARARRRTHAAGRSADDQRTMVSNASTFAQITMLALLGPERFASVGLPEEPGTVLLSVSGSAKTPAVVECPTGARLGAVLDLCRAPAGDGVLVGGYHGMWLPSDIAYRVPVGREGLAAVDGIFGPGIVLPLGDGTCPLGEVARIASYLAAESAGHCQSCRLQLPSIADTLTEIVNGSAAITAIDEVRRVAAATRRDACSHTHGTIRFVMSALEVFTEDLAAHVFHFSCGQPVRAVLPLPDSL